jgi:hypothetical protein
MGERATDGSEERLSAKTLEGTVGTGYRAAGAMKQRFSV